MILKIKQIVIIVTITCFLSCKQEKPVLIQISGTQIAITDTIDSTVSIEEFVAPYRDRINEVLDSTLAYAPTTISKNDGALNTTAGNLMADAVLELTAPIFKSRTGSTLDLVLLNHGGIRSTISAGNVSARTAYEIMPFENTIVVVGLKGDAILEMVNYLIKSKKPHPLAGLQITLNKDDSIHEIRIQGQLFDESKTYYVATSNYLVNGGDHMDFFKNKVTFTETDYRIRNIMIDYFSKKDTIAPIIDDRFIKLDY
ncbi:5'-nucleotidase C-terminal domain-containing protein [Cellulophaga sp. L1A9]|uniref:5'-nucleotidase C-terminal domain-containing protein n=1 Tax=Cellulophaga sp. L1A9 TaxID=2686362 RepID=UPI001E559460|nr:5'-nucleotidase [Cellulophaga sp. L1A9]